MIRAAFVVPILALAALAGLPCAANANGLAGFEPETFATAGVENLWVLGTVPCHAARCRALLRSTDSGRSFERVTAPPADGTIRFSDSRHGFAYGVSSLWATRDGGVTWRLSLRHVLAFATGAGRIYAVTGRCNAKGSCTGIGLARSPVTADAWASSAMPFAHASPNFDLAVTGASVWLFGGQYSGGRLDNLLARSVDHGRRFLTSSAPCEADLAAELEPSPDGTLWAFCPTGMMGAAWRSPDGGRTFKPLPIARCCINGAQLAPASATTAVLAPSVSGRPALLRTTDEGRHWKAVRVPKPVLACLSIGFTDRRDGWALVQVHPTGPAELWRTVDGGSSWQRVPIQA